jgi:hypothetical protein
MLVNNATANTTPATGTPNSSFYAQAFRKNESVVIAFRGSDDLGDILTDLEAFFWGKPEQYSEALKFVEDCQAAGIKDENITLTGHSLGGGLASYAAFYYKIPATVFNSAGLGSGLRANANVAQNLHNQDLVRNLIMERDPISKAVTDKGNQVGVICKLSPSKEIEKEVEFLLGAPSFGAGGPAMGAFNPGVALGRASHTAIRYHSMEALILSLQALIK